MSANGIRPGRRLALLLTAAAVGVLGTGGVANAASFTVNDTTDAPLATPAGTSCVSSHGGSCTLRAAVQAADNSGGASTITVPAGTFTITIGPAGSDDPSDGDFDIDNGASVTITGAGDASTTIDANQLDRAFDVAPGASLSLSAMTIENGFPAERFGDGGAITSQGALSVNDVTFQQNSQSDFLEAVGGAISAEQPGAPLIVTNSTFVDNSAGNGGALADFESTGLTLDNDRFVDNFAEAGGALWVESGDTFDITLDHDEFDHNQGVVVGGAAFLAVGPVSIDGSTFTGNSGGQLGGAIDFELLNTVPQASLVDSTIDDNTADAGGGLSFDFANQVTLVNDTITANGSNGLRAEGTLAAGSSVVNTIIADNEPSDCGDAPIPAADDLGFNLDSDGSCFTGDESTDKTRVDPLLGQPADNGGSVLTDALALGSPAIDAGSNGGCPVVDARGVARPQGVSCDIGAYEFAAAGLSLAAAAPSTATTGVPFDYTLTASSAGPGPSTATTVVDHLPANVRLFGTTSSRGSCTSSGSPATVTCDLGAIAAGSSATVGLVVSVSQPGSVTNAVTVSNGEGASASARAGTMVLAPVAPAGATGPTATTGAATGIAAHSATLTGKVSTGGQPTSYFFEYGRAKSLGLVTVVRRISSNASVSAVVAGLTAATTYHYRLVAVNDSGSSDGAKLTFQSTGRRRPGGVEIRVVHRSDGSLKLAGAVKLPGGMPRAAGCSGRVVIAVRRGSKTIGSRRAKLSRKCTYSTTFTVASGRAGESVRAGAQFLGNKVLTAAKSKVLTIHLG